MRVADEVRKLAESSRSSADDISSHLNDFLHLTEQAMREMNASTEDVQQGSKVVALIGEKLLLIGKQFDLVNDRIQHESAIIQQMSAGSEEVLASAEEMKRLVDTTVDQTKHIDMVAKGQVTVVDTLTTVVKQLDNTSTDVIRDIEQFKL